MCEEYNEEDDEDLDIFDYEIMDDEKKLDSDVEKYCCSRGCFNCLDMSFRDFM